MPIVFDKKRFPFTKEESFLFLLRFNRIGPRGHCYFTVFTSPWTILIKWKKTVIELEKPPAKSLAFRIFFRPTNFISLGVLVGSKKSHVGCLLFLQAEMGFLPGFGNKKKITFYPPTLRQHSDFFFYLARSREKTHSRSAFYTETRLGFFPSLFFMYLLIIKYIRA
jgi:hypothetical protein